MWLPLRPSYLLPRPWENVKTSRRAKMSRGPVGDPDTPPPVLHTHPRTQCSILPRGIHEGGASLLIPRLLSWLSLLRAHLSGSPSLHPPHLHLSESHLSVCISSFSLSLFPGLPHLCLFLSLSVSALSWSLISFPVFLITSVPLPCFPLSHPVPLLPLSSLPPLPILSK